MTGRTVRADMSEIQAVGIIRYRIKSQPRGMHTRLLVVPHRNSQSIVEALHRDDRIGSAECEGIANSCPDRTCPRTTGCHVEIAFGIEFFDVNRGWNDTFADRLDDGDQLERTARAERVAMH